MTYTTNSIGLVSSFKSNTLHIDCSEVPSGVEVVIMLPLYLFCETKPCATDRKESLVPGDTGGFRQTNALLGKLPIFRGTAKVK